MKVKFNSLPLGAPFSHNGHRWKKTGPQSANSIIGDYFFAEGHEVHVPSLLTGIQAKAFLDVLYALRQTPGSTAQVLYVVEGGYVKVFETIAGTINVQTISVAYDESCKIEPHENAFAFAMAYEIPFLE